MTDEERRRTMEFILEQQARMTVHFEKLEEERIRDRPRMTGLEESFKTLVDLCRIHDIRLDAVESSTSTLEGAVQELDRLIKKNEARLGKLESRATRWDDSLQS